MGVDVGEGEAGVAEDAVGDDGVLEAAGLPDHGDGAVAHGDHLAQAAGLGQGGHEEDVGAAVDGGGEGGGVLEPGGKAAGVLGLGLAEGLLKVPLAGAQHHHLDVHAHDVVDGVGHQLEALVLDQPGHAGDDGHVGVLPEAHRLLEGPLAGGLAAQVVGVEGGGQAGAVGGVIEGGVQAVEDAPHLPAVVGHHALQAVGVEGVLELAGVGGGDGGDVVGGIDGTLHQVHVPVVGQHVLVHVAGVEAQQVLDDLVAVAALVLDVVDGEDALGAPELPDALPLLQQVDGHQGGLPVVAVEDVGVPVQVGRGLDDGPGEEGEALAVVVVAIDLGPLEVVLVVHEEVGDVALPQLEDAAVGGAPGQTAVPVEHKAHLLPVLLGDALVEGEDDLHVMAHVGQLLGEGTGHVGQAAGLDEGGDLGGCKQNIHI